jgi:hypothetical protein
VLAARDERAQTGKVTGSAGVRAGLIELVQRVDDRAGRPVETCGAEGDGFLGALGRDVDDNAVWGDVLDGVPERGTARRVEDPVEVTVHLLDDVSSAQAAQQCLGGGGVAHEGGGVGAAGVRKLDRDTPDATGRSRDQHPLGEDQPGDLQRPHAVISAVGSVTACASDTSSGIGASLSVGIAASYA